jgi:hypothetical protein
MNCGSYSVYAIELNISEIPVRLVLTLASLAADNLTWNGNAGKRVSVRLGR